MSQNKKDKIKMSQAIKNNAFILKIAFSASPGLFTMRLIMGFVTGLNHGVSVYFIGQVLNAIDLGSPVSEILKIIGAMAAYHLAYILFSNWHWRVYHPKYKLDFIRRLHKKFFVKAWEMDLSCYDTPEFYNDFIYSMQNSDKSIMGTIDQLAEIIRGLVASVSVFAIALSVNYIIAIVILGYSIINMILGILEDGLYYKYEIVLNKVYRKEWYHERFFSLADYAKEIRLTDISENIMAEYHKNKDEEKKYHTERNLKLTFFSFTRTLLKIAEDVFIILFMAYHLMVTESVLVGGFSMALMASYKLSSMFDDIQYRITQISKNSL